MSDTFENILQRLIKATGSKNASEMANALGLSPQSVYSAKTKGKIPPAWIFAAAERFNASADWIYFGYAMPKDTTLTPPQLAFCPFLDSFFNSGKKFDEIDLDALPRLPFTLEKLLRLGRPEAMVVIRVYGNSMSPEIINNDLVMIDTSMRAIIPGELYGVEFEKSLYFKRIDTLPGQILLKCHDPSFPTIKVAADDYADSISIIGRVVWCSREYSPCADAVDTLETLLP